MALSGLIPITLMWMARFVDSLTPGQKIAWRDGQGLLVAILQ